MLHKKILLIGPLPEPVTGITLINKTLLKDLEKYSNGYKISAINTSNYSDIINPGKFSLKKASSFSKFYKDIFKVFSHDIIYICIGQTFLGIAKYAPFVFFAKILRKPVIIHLHGDQLIEEYRIAANWKRAIMKAILSKSDKGIVSSKTMSKNLTPFLDQNKIYFLPNFVEDILFDNRDLDKPLDKLHIVFLSNLMTEKGIFDFLQALQILKKNNIDFNASLGGQIELGLEDKIEQILKTLGDNVKYLGVIKGNSKKTILRQSNVFVLPTKFLEGYNITILEAMATGNIILSTKTGAIADIFEENENKIGFVINKEDPNDIAEKLITISNNLSSYQNIMLSNQRIAKQKYRLENFMNGFIKILEN